MLESIAEKSGFRSFLRKAAGWTSPFQAALLGSDVVEETLLELLRRHYRWRFRREWLGPAGTPHFFSNRVWHFEVGFGRCIGPQAMYRAFFASEVVRPGDRLLDISCGDGFFTRRFFSKECSQVDAIDLEPSAIAAANQRYSAPHIRYRVADAVSEPFPSAEYDVVVWDGAIGHFSSADSQLVLSKIAACLAPDGIFVGSESLGDSEGPDHLQFFHSLEDLAETFGRFFPQVQVREVQYEIPAVPGNLRREGYWRCAHSPKRLIDSAWTVGAKASRGFLRSSL